MQRSTASKSGSELIESKRIPAGAAAAAIEVVEALEAEGAKAATRPPRRSLDNCRRGLAVFQARRQPRH